MKKFLVCLLALCCTAQRVVRENKEVVMPTTHYWNSTTGQWVAGSFSDSILPVVGDTVIADGRSQKAFITSLDRSGDVYATERVTNGAFAADTNWTKGTGWTISGGKAVAAAGSASDLEQASILVVGRSYYVTYTVTDRTAGTITAKCGTGAGTARSTNATFSENIVCAGSTSLIFSKSSTFDGKIDDVTVVESVGLDLAKFETTAAYRGDVGTPDQPWKGTADLFVHRGSGKLYFQPAHSTGLAMDKFVLDTPNLSHEVAFGKLAAATDSRILTSVILRGRAKYFGELSGFNDSIYIGYIGNPVVDAYVTFVDSALCRDVTQYAGTLIYNGQYYDVSDRFLMAGGYCQFNGLHAIYVQTAGHVDFGVIPLTVGNYGSIITAYLLGGSMDATKSSLPKTITTAYIAPTFELVEDDTLTITNRYNLWE